MAPINMLTRLALLAAVTSDMGERRSVCPCFDSGADPCSPAPLNISHLILTMLCQHDICHTFGSIKAYLQYDGNVFPPTLRCAAATLSAAAATAGPRSAPRKLQEADTEFPVTGSSGEEYVVEFDDATGDEVIVMTESDEVPVETTVVVTGSSITSIVVGTDTFEVQYDASGEVSSVTLVPPSATTRRTQVARQVDFEDRRLQSCEDSCEANANRLCGALIFGCSDSTGTLATLLGVLCDDLENLCDASGIVEGCDRTCAPCECTPI